MAQTSYHGRVQHLLYSSRQIPTRCANRVHLSLERFYPFFYLTWTVQELPAVDNDVVYRNQCSTRFDTLCLSWTVQELPAVDNDVVYWNQCWLCRLCSVLGALDTWARHLGSTLRRDDNNKPRVNIRISLNINHKHVLQELIGRLHLPTNRKSAY